MLRSTKIVATLGPASSDAATLERMIRAGVDVVRLNFSHGTAQDHEKRAALVKELASKLGRTVAILCDLQGPKIRVGKFKEGKINLEKGQPFILDAAEVRPFEQLGREHDLRAFGRRLAHQLGDGADVRDRVVGEGELQRGDGKFGHSLLRHPRESGGPAAFQ